MGADIGGNTIKIAVVRMSGEIVAVKSYPLKLKQSRDYLLNKLFNAIRDIRKLVAAKGIIRRLACQLIQSIRLILAGRFLN